MSFLLPVIPDPAFRQPATLPRVPRFLCTGGARYPPQHVHTQAFVTPFHRMASMELRRGTEVLGGDGQVARAGVAAILEGAIRFDGRPGCPCECEGSLVGCGPWRGRSRGARL
jgi:hypothetical protein